MGKKHILLCLLALLLLLSGCAAPEDLSATEPSAASTLLLAQDKSTPYTVVSYLEDQQPVKMFLADLLIKTGASYRLVDQPQGKTIFIGTADQFQDQGGASALTYTKYQIWTEDENLYISMADASMVRDVLAIVEEAISKDESGAFVLDLSIEGVSDISPISEVIPMFEIPSGQKDAPHDCGNGNYMVRYYALKNEDVAQALADYEAALTANGFSLYQQNTVSGSLFLTYVKGDTLVHCNYFAPMREFRVVYGPMTAMYQNTPVENYQKLVTPSVSIIQGTENVECLVVQVADGSFYVIDGGWSTSGWQTKTLNAGDNNERSIRYYRDAEGDMLTLYNFLKENTPGGGKPQVTWMLSHADPDHILLPTRFFKDYRELFDLNMVIYNFPNLYNIGLGESGGSTNDPNTMTSYADAFIKSVRENFPEAQHYVYHTGEKLYIPGGDIEFLMVAGEDYYPNAMPWMNHTCGIWRFTVDGSTVMFGNDAETGLNRQVAGVFGDYLKSDVLQVVHHGANGGTLAFYKAVDPTVCFWACQQYHLDFDNRQLGLKPGFEFNKFLRQSEKIVAHYSNSQTHTVLLPSLEEKQ